MSGTSASPLDPYLSQIKTWADEGKTNAQIVAELRTEYEIVTSEASVRRAKRRDENVAPRMKGEPNFALRGDEATINSEEELEPPSPEDLMDKHGLNPDDWDIRDVILNEWTAMTSSQNENRLKKMYQLKVILRRKAPLNWVFPARTPGDTFEKPVYTEPTQGESRLWVIAGDQQAPYHDEQMHKALCNLIAAEKPHGMVNTGDTLDFPDHCIDVGYNLLRDYRLANEEMRMVKMLGNHDIRIRSELLNRAERLYGIRKAQVPGEEAEMSVLDIRNLLRLDELQIEMVDPNGEYEHAQFKISDQVAVRHGSRTGKDAALKTIDRLTHSVIMGHTHQQSLQHRTIYDIDRTRQTIQAVETGTLCAIDGGLGYAVDPNWVNGFATVEVFEDGSHNIELAFWDGEFIHWRGKRYGA
jgi:hypothetical protein